MPRIDEQQHRIYCTEYVEYVAVHTSNRVHNLIHLTFGNYRESLIHRAIYATTIWRKSKKTAHHVHAMRPMRANRFSGAQLMINRPIVKYTCYWCLLLLSSIHGISFGRLYPFFFLGFVTYLMLWATTAMLLSMRKTTTHQLQLSVRTRAVEEKDTRMAIDGSKKNWCGQLIHPLPLCSCSRRKRKFDLKC